MKKFFITLFFTIFIVGAYAQIPVILESELIKKKQEASSKKSKPEKVESDDTESTDENGNTSTTTQESTEQKQTDVATELSKLGTNSQVTSNKEKETTTKSTTNRFRDRQKKVKSN